MPKFVYVHMSSGALGGQKRVSDLPGTEVPDDCEPPAVGAGMELSSSGETASAPNC